MFQSFTGSSRRPRQVNLGSRTSNPFAGFPSGRGAPHGGGPQNTLAIAQQERMLRQQERERLSASRRIQRTWRGYRSRKTTRSIWRSEWDAVEQGRVSDELSFESPGGYDILRTHPPVRYSTPTECLSQLRLLLHFLEMSNGGDILRLLYFAKAFQQTLVEVPSIATEGEWTTLLVRLAKATLRVLHASVSSALTSKFAISELLQLLVFLTSLVPKQLARIADDYYSAMAVLTRNFTVLSKETNLTRDMLVESVLALLRPITSETLSAYEWFARVYLTIPDLDSRLGTIEDLATNINYRLLASALDVQVSQIPSSPEDTENRLWLLAYFIFFHRHALGGVVQKAPEPEFVKVVSFLLNSVALYVSRRLEIDESTDSEEVQGSPLHPFVREQITSLVNQNSITGLLSQIPSSRLSSGGLQDNKLGESGEAKILATYALTLLRVFPRRGDDIRMWLYLGSASANDNGAQPGSRVPAIKYFWQASRSTKIFARVSRDSNEVLPLLKPLRPVESANGNVLDYSQQERDQEWTIILLFLELYTFVLKVMDDDEFFSGGSSLTVPSSSRVSWTKESALPLRDIKDMTVFLKNLGFTLYWNAVDLNETNPLQETTSIRNYFSSSASSPEPLITVKDVELRNKEKGLPGVTGIPLDYFKGLVTGLLRMIHERE